MICNNCGKTIDDGLERCPFCEEVLLPEPEEPEAEAFEADIPKAEVPDTDIPESDVSCGNAEETESDAEEICVETPDEEYESADDDNQEEETARRSGWTWLTTVIVAATALIVLGLAGFWGWHEGWFDSLKPKTRSACDIGDYSKIEVLRSSVEVTDEQVDEYIEMLLSDYPDEELTDEWCIRYASEVMGAEVDGVSGFRTYMHDYISRYALHTQMLDYLTSITEIKSYDEDILEQLIAYSDQGLEYYANAYGMSKEALVQSSGYSSVIDYETDEAKHYMDTTIMLDRIVKDLKLNYSQEDVDADMQRYMNMNRLSERYTLDEFKEVSGEAWCYLYEHMQFQSDFAMDALEDRVVYLEDTPE